MGVQNIKQIILQNQNEMNTQQKIPIAWLCRSLPYITRDYTSVFAN